MSEVYPPDVAAVARARQLVIDCRHAWDMTALSRSLELVVSELFTNAVRHGRGPVVVRLHARDERIQLEVEDRGGGGRPAIQPADPSGRRLGGGRA